MLITFFNVQIYFEMYYLFLSYIVHSIISPRIYSGMSYAAQTLFKCG